MTDDEENVTQRLTTKTAIAHGTGRTTGQDFLYVTLTHVIALVSLFYTSKAMAIVSFILLLFYFNSIFSKSYRTASALLPLLFLFVSESISMLDIEIFNAYMTETGKTGYLTGGTSRLIALQSLFFFVVSRQSAKIDQLLDVPEDDKIRFLRFFEYTALLISACFVLYLLFVGIERGFPLLTGAERFLYRRQAGDLFDSVLNNKTIPLLLLGALTCRGRYRKTATFMAVALVGVVVLMGEKFTSVGLYICQYGSVVLALRGKPVSRSFLVYAGSAIMLIIIATTLSSYNASGNIESAVAAFAGRVALNGQPWFLADLHWLSGAARFDDQAFGSEISAIFDRGYRGVDQVNADFGLYRFMMKFALPDIYQYYRSDEIGFIFTLLPQWLVSYGMVATMALNALSGFVYYFEFYCLILAINKRNYFWIIVFIKIITWNLNGRIIGYSYLIFGVENFSLMILYFLIKKLLVHRHIIPRDQRQEADMDSHQRLNLSDGSHEATEPRAPGYSA